MKKFFIILVLLPLVASAQEYTNRVWTQKSGNTVDAKYVSSDHDNIVLEQADGEKLKIPESKLSTKDLKYIKSILPKVTGKIHRPYTTDTKSKFKWITIEYALVTKEERITKPSIRVYRYIENSKAKLRLHGLTKGSKKAPAFDKALFPAKAFKTYRHRAVAHREDHKLLLIRIELWHEGLLLDFIDTSTPSTLKLYELKDEWWVN